MVCEVAGIGGEGEEAGGERVRLRGVEGISGTRDRDAGLRSVRGNADPCFARDDNAVFRRIVASGLGWRTASERGPYNGEEKDQANKDRGKYRRRVQPRDGKASAAYPGCALIYQGTAKSRALMKNKVMT